MQHSLLALVVIPDLRISDKGIVDVSQFRIVDLLTDDQPGSVSDPSPASGQNGLCAISQTCPSGSAK